MADLAKRKRAAKKSARLHPLENQGLVITSIDEMVILADCIESTKFTFSMILDDNDSAMQQLETLQKRILDCIESICPEDREVH